VNRPERHGAVSANRASRKGNGATHAVAAGFAGATALMPCARRDDDCRNDSLAYYRSSSSRLKIFALLENEEGGFLELERISFVTTDRTCSRLARPQRPSRSFDGVLWYCIVVARRRSLIRARDATARVGGKDHGAAPKSDFLVGGKKRRLADNRSIQLCDARWNFFS